VRWGAPQLGEHNDEILRELRLSEEEIVEMRRERVVGA
jgi:crotonobetainyl-CoA:carnitine CoA-transferase CaiB-like acyl-CoA transferase